MISLNVLLYIFMFLFAVIGSMRGWAKELLVTFSIILAIFIITVLERYAPPLKGLAVIPQFWMRFGIFTLLSFFGYQTPNLPKLASSGKFAREKLQDSLLGFFIGAANGYLIYGAIWSFMNDAAYPFPVITKPDLSEDELRALMNLMPPHWLTPPLIYFAVAIAFVFVLIVFI